MKTFGIVSYNIYCNFTNHGLVLQSWALGSTIERPNRFHGCYSVEDSLL